MGDLHEVLPESQRSLPGFFLVRCVVDMRASVKERLSLCFGEKLED